MYIYFFLPILVQSRPYVIFIENIIMAVSGHCVEYLRKSKKKKKSIKNHQIKW